MSAQLARLEAKATELETMISYVRAKIDWLTRGEQGRQPDFGSYATGDSRGHCG
jgi:MerR family copper efflux transcriptional regulator